MALDLILYILIAILFIVGVLSTLVGLPGIWLVLLGILIHYFFINSFFHWSLVIVLIIVVALVSLVDNIFMLLGAKRMGASNKALYGAVSGAVIGFLTFNIVGLLIGSFFGAAAVEYFLMKKTEREALRAGFGTFVGFVSSIIFKFIFAILLVLTWLAVLLILT